MNENVQKLKKLEIDRSGNGFLTNFNQWNIEVGEMIAKEHNINLTNTHWDIISWIQELYKAKKEVSIEAIIKTEIVNTNELFDLFTDDPILVSTKIAGLPCLTKLKKTA
ncbi:TusE/DsrC/DsvC family sulfur relay protein [uncultured Polaribacter sp.]|uniref:TusE/DsrC/DsvC family sulfur relay protein n=1 Tax=uncultured Polaribacter sp. TaxID=174711 RepID=UPI0026128F1D|nr:TusE/DsrC/DsvC family sulfur relay protein [uncultured Polaribacter sp.]